MNETTNKPNAELAPGSKEACDAGCKCPRYDNRHGRGMYNDENGVPQFVTIEDCPLHGWPTKEIPT